ncbi:MAG: hypothetical protein P4M15_01335 [Alphaproteobacteria bacterium]|nr:hypothetical protein [Alphaproteobacteria bacterium]
MSRDGFLSGIEPARSAEEIKADFARNRNFGRWPFDERAGAQEYGMIDMGDSIHWVEPDGAAARGARTKAGSASVPVIR